MKNTILILAALLVTGGLAHPQEPDAPAPTKVRIAGGVIAGNILTKVAPSYPAEARAAHISGTVVMHAIIGRDGAVKNLQVISGPDMLRDSAVAAVSQWTYKPYTLNGEPTEVDTTITVNYNFGPPPAAPQREPDAPVKVSGGVMAGTILTKGQPICSPEHKNDHVSGAVVIDAIISPDGHVVNMNVISGPEALRACVLDAVSQWTYKPYLLNGVPTAVETTITVFMQVGGGTETSPPPPSVSTSEPIRISGSIMAGMIITKVWPVYPPEAREQHINGAVVLSVIIGTDGHVKSAQAISGPAMLRPNWEEAVRQWTYKPYLLAGVPTEVQTTITITNNFGGS